MIPGLQVCRNYRLEILRNAAFSENLALIGLAQHVAAAPDGLDVVLAARRHRTLLAQLADEDVVDRESAGLDDRLRMAFRPAHDGVDTGDQLILVEGLGHVVVGTEAEPADLILDAGKAGEDQDGGLHLGDAEGAEHLVAAHVGQVQVKQDDVVIIQLAKIDALFAEVRRVHIETFGFEHQFDALRRRAVVLNQEYTHAVPLKVVPRWNRARQAISPRPLTEPYFI